MTVRGYKDLIAWQKAMDLADDVYSVTEEFPAREMYGLSSQLRRSAVSVPSNIAEGSGRLSSGEWLQFLGQARGSLYEAQTQLMLAQRRSYVSEQAVSAIIERSDEVARILNGLMRAAAVKFETKKFGGIIKDEAIHYDVTLGSEAWIDSLPIDQD